MKTCYRIIPAIMAIVVSFTVVCAVEAAADIEEFEGVATSVSNRAISLDAGTDGTADVTVWHMGPARFWEAEGVSYPNKGAMLRISAYYSDINDYYVGVAVCYLSDTGVEAPCIYLREGDTLKPIWDKSDAYLYSADEAVDTPCSEFPCLEYCDPISHEYLEPGPHGFGLKP